MAPRIRAVLHRFGHGGGSVQIPAHGGHASDSPVCRSDAGPPHCSRPLGRARSPRCPLPPKRRRGARRAPRQNLNSTPQACVRDHGFRGMPHGGSCASHGEFTQVELSQQDGASLLQARDHCGVGIRYEVAIHARAVGGENALVQNWSFTATGTPNNGPTSPPRSTVCSAWRAAASASSRMTVIYACSSPSNCSMRAR